MKTLITLILLLTLCLFVNSSCPNSKKKEKCVRAVCICVDESMAPLVKPNCPNDKINKCLENAKCHRNKDGDCEILLTGNIKKCLKAANVFSEYLSTLS